MNLDKEVLKYFSRTETEAESMASFERNRTFLNENSFGLWALEEKESQSFIGFVGISLKSGFNLPFMPCHEIGWRLNKRFWGKGYATEAAETVLGYGLGALSIKEIFSYTSELNVPSMNVMRKIGLHARPELNFNHPIIEVGNPLSSHVVYST